MADRIFVRTCCFCLFAIASMTAVNSVRAQSVEPGSQQQPTTEFNRGDRNSSSIRREQAPLPLNRVYQTPIEQFEHAFTDVPRNHWAYEAVTRLFYSGVVKGEPASPNSSTQSN